MPSPLSRTLHVLDKALDQSHVVKAEVEACAEVLRSANAQALAQVEGGATTLPAAPVLQQGLAVEQRVQGVAEDLAQVTENLERGVDEVKAVELALRHSRVALAESEAALAASRNAERTAQQQALHDEKTGLPNRTLFDNRLTQALAGAERHGWTLAVMFLDLGRFKLVNDPHGHAAGDTVLQTVAERLRRHARDEDSVCRNGGDEFLYLLMNPSGRDAVARIASLVRQAIAEPIVWGTHQFSITSSIGIALYPAHGQTGPSLVASADAAMYRAKREGRPFAFFEPAMAPAQGPR